MAIFVNGRSFQLDGDKFSYVLLVDEHGYLNNAYYGPKIPLSDLGYFRPVWNEARSAQINGTTRMYDDLMSEYSFANTGDYRESAFLCEDTKGNRVFDLRYKSYRIEEIKPKISSGIPTARGGQTLIITLCDSVSSLEVELYYTAYENENILTRRACILNKTGEPIKLLRALSITLDLPNGNYNMLGLWGHHARERQVDISPLRHGVQSIGSYRACSSHEHNPFVALVGQNADEEHGEVIGCALMYSGSHYEAVELDSADRVRLVSGITPFDFCWVLNDGECFETP